MPELAIGKLVMLFFTFLSAFFFFRWFVNVGKEIATYFAFSSSDVIASDLATTFNTLVGIPGNVTLSYSFPRTSGVYEVKIKESLICVTSRERLTGLLTSHCKSLSLPSPFSFEELLEVSEEKYPIFIFEKKIGKEGMKLFLYIEFEERS